MVNTVDVNVLPRFDIFIYLIFLGCYTSFLSLYAHEYICVT